jgi:hypothetical protein
LHFVSFPIINMGRRDIDIAFSDIKDKEIAWTKKSYTFSIPTCILWLFVSM